MKTIEDPKRVTVCAFTGMSQAAVYTGGLGWLEPAQGLQWREDEYSEEFGEPMRVLTLDEISRQLGERAAIITVIVDDPFVATVYQWGNYGDCWVILGTLAGYA